MPLQTMKNIPAYIYIYIYMYVYVYIIYVYRVVNHLKGKSDI